ncbi:MAG: YdbL family protein [Gammaproteobacteria bacterium]|nr:YdbL family protein [Gammaproteobacteria bacterium]MCP5137126.1 YdbL family protein [Gammaproteobacteria bacterium]
MTAYLRSASLVLFTLLISACVTINIYFPAAAAEKAADRIIQDVWGAQPNPQSPSAPEAPPQSAIERERPLALSLLEWMVAPAQAADLDVSSPAIAAAQGAMKARFADLEAHMNSGALGLTRDGLVDVRDLNAIPLPKRGPVKQLVAAENADRNVLYREIAAANGHPEWERDIRNTFSERWVGNARGGWWYQDASGAWKQK